MNLQQKLHVFTINLLNHFEIILIAVTMQLIQLIWSRFHEFNFSFELFTTWNIYKCESCSSIFFSNLNDIQ